MLRGVMRDRHPKRSLMERAPNRRRPESRTAQSLATTQRSLLRSWKTTTTTSLPACNPSTSSTTPFSSSSSKLELASHCIHPLHARLRGGMHGNLRALNIYSAYICMQDVLRGTWAAAVQVSGEESPRGGIQRTYDDACCVLFLPVFFVFFFFSVPIRPPWLGMERH